MTDNPTSPVPSASLDALRRDIDAADEEMHRLLIHRGQVIEQLIAAKKVGARSAAFRPDREADMMRRIAARHDGQLPLSTVEHIWREIIGTFTQLQARFRILAADADAPHMRDLLRFNFGFMAELVATGSSREAVDMVADSGEDLAVVPVDDPLEERWWAGLPLAGDAATGTRVTGAKIIAALPFLALHESLDFPRVFVIGPANVDGLPDLFTYSIDQSADPGGLPGKVISKVISGGSGCNLIVSRLPPEEFARVSPDAIFLGSFAEPVTWSD